jgi:hypothetical protein
LYFSYRTPNFSLIRCFFLLNDAKIACALDLEDAELWAEATLALMATQHRKRRRIRVNNRINGSLGRGTELVA